MIHFSKILSKLLLANLLLFTACAQSQESEAPTPPKGYWNMTFVKAAYALGMLDIVDTEPEIPESLQAYTDLVFKETPQKTLKLDIYHKKNISSATPLLIFIHGGSWKAGKKDDYRRYLVDYAEKGYITATISYRFSKHAPFPAALDDVVCALKWLKEHAEAYHIDTERIAVIGGSAGAHLAMMIGYHSRDTSYPQPSSCGDSINTDVKAIVNLYGPTDLTTEYGRNHPAVIQFIGTEYSKETHDAFWAASPLQYVTADDPPTLTFHGTIDDIVPVSQADRLDALLQEKGVPSYYHKLKGWPHTMDAQKDVNTYCQYYMDEFFEKYLK